MSKHLKLVLLFALLTLCIIVQAETLTAEAAQQAAIQGDAKAQAQLGAMYLLGRNGVDKDEVQAAEWFIKAAEQGLVEAEVVVAALYDRGLGVTQNVETATGWYEKAASAGHAPSLAILGKNAAPQGSIAFNYKMIRLSAAKQIPTEYANKLLLSK